MAPPSATESMSGPTTSIWPSWISPGSTIRTYSTAGEYL